MPCLTLPNEVSKTCESSVIVLDGESEEKDNEGDEDGEEEDIEDDDNIKGDTKRGGFKP